MTQAQLRVTAEQAAEMLEVFNRHEGRTPTPWTIEDDGDDYVIVSKSAKAEVGRVPHGQGSDLDAHTIVNAVNSYRDLLETVEHLNARLIVANATRVALEQEVDGRGRDIAAVGRSRDEAVARATQSEAKMREYVEACDAMDNFPILSDASDYEGWCQRFDAAGARVKTAFDALRANPATRSST